MRTLLALLAMSILSAACKERKADPRPNYEGSRDASERSHKSLDEQSRGE